MSRRYVDVVPLLFGALVSLTHHRRADAQPAFVPPAGPAVRPVLLFGVGLDPAVAAYVRYLRPLAGADARAGVVFGGGLKVPTTVLSHRAVRVELSGATYRVRADGWAASGEASAFLANEHNAAGTMRGIGIELRGTGGRRSAKTFIGLDAGWQAALATHIAHGPAARAAFRDRYPDGVADDAQPRDGWYRVPAQRFRIGGVLDRRLGRRGGAMRLALGGMFIRQKQGQLFAFDLGQVPFYLEPSIQVPW